MKTLAIAAALVAATPALANSGHVIQVHHGGACVEFVTFEDAVARCGSASAAFLSNGTVNPSCMAILPWYGFTISTDPTQIATTISQLPSFIAFTSAVDTAFHETQAVFGSEDIQVGEGFGLPQSEVNLLFGPDSALGFTPNSTAATCTNIDGSGPHAIISVGNLNTPPAPNQ